MSRIRLARALGIASLGIFALYNVGSIAQAKPTLEIKIDTAQPTPYWMFLHMQKAGGTTINNILKGRWKKKTAVYNTVNWKKGDGSTRAYVGCDTWRIDRSIETFQQ